MIIIIIIIIIYRSLVAARSPPVSIARPDGKCPDLMTMHMVPWSLSLGRGEVPLCVDTFCPSIEQEPGKKLHIQNPKSEEVRPPQLCLSVSAVCNGDWRFHRSRFQDIPFGPWQTSQNGHRRATFLCFLAPKDLMQWPSRRGIPCLVPFPLIPNNQFSDENDSFVD